MLARENAETFGSPFVSALGVSGVSTFGVSTISVFCGVGTSVAGVGFSAFGFEFSFSRLWAFAFGLSTIE
ncbi:hypothetical protein [Flavobacterium sp. N1736]|uniref:hypothetical protein n=1 Tax=Flavobacterium sp. N1736 TaxID=2986823 RepID=UPI002224FCF5|nr:hypothetical protein [Flavobacterium sp. N1736]